MDDETLNDLARAVAELRATRTTLNTLYSDTQALKDRLGPFEEIERIQHQRVFDLLAKVTQP